MLVLRPLRGSMKFRLLPRRDEPELELEDELELDELGLDDELEDELEEDESEE